MYENNGFIVTLNVLLLVQNESQESPGRFYAGMYIVQYERQFGRQYHVSSTFGWGSKPSTLIEGLNNMIKAKSDRKRIRLKS